MRLLLGSVLCVLPAAAQQRDPGGFYRAFWLEKQVDKLPALIAEGELQEGQRVLDALWAGMRWRRGGGR